MNKIKETAGQLELSEQWTEVLLRVHRYVLTTVNDADGSAFAGHQNAKGDASYKGDLAAERMVVEQLSRAREPLLLVSEESGEYELDASARYRAVIDPIDGSDNWARDLPLSALSIAVLPVAAALHPRAVKAAVVGPLDGREAYVFSETDGGRRGSKRLETSKVRKLEDAFISVELNHHKRLSMLNRLVGSARAVRSYGCASRALALIAGGQLDAHVDVRERLTPESYLAGAALVIAAGGVVMAANGAALPLANDLTTRTSLVAAATPELARHVEEVLRNE